MSEQKTITRFYKDIKNFPRVDGDLINGDLKAAGDNCVQIGEWEHIGQFPLVSLSGMGLLHPYLPGQVRIGSVVEDYDTLKFRTRAEWYGLGYSLDHVDVILKTLNYFQSIENLVFLDRKVSK